LGDNGKKPGSFQPWRQFVERNPIPVREILGLTSEENTSEPARPRLAENASSGDQCWKEGPPRADARKQQSPGTRD